MSVSQHPQTGHPLQLCRWWHFPEQIPPLVSKLLLTTLSAQTPSLPSGVSQARSFPLAAPALGTPAALKGHTPLEQAGPGVTSLLLTPRHGAAPAMPLRPPPPAVGQQLPPTPWPGSVFPTDHAKKSDRIPRWLWPARRVALGFLSLSRELCNSAFPSCFMSPGLLSQLAILVKSQCYAALLRWWGSTGVSLLQDLQGSHLFQGRSPSQTNIRSAVLDLCKIFGCSSLPSDSVWSDIFGC